MKRRWTFILAFAVIVGLLLWNNLASNNRRAPAHSPDVGSVSIRGESLPASEAHENERLPSPVSKSPRSNNNSPEKAIEGYWQSIHRPIDFYGKVVDQDGQPLAGAAISFIWTQFRPELTLRTNVVSDTNGLFDLHVAKGATLTVLVEKRGYYPIKSLNQTGFDYTLSPGSPNTQTLRPDPQSPVVFHLQNRGKGVDLMTSPFPALKFNPPRDGTPVWVDFYNQRVGASGQMEVRSVKPSDQGGTEWSFRLLLPDGGLVEEHEEFPFEAPRDGYEKSVAFKFKNGETHLKKRYYIAFGQLRKYGRIEVRTGMYIGVNLTYLINPDGSRNLEPNETKPDGSAVPPGMRAVIPKRRQE